jgi:hypothetical protein
VTENCIFKIYTELSTLKLSEARNAIAALLRLFLEMSSSPTGCSQPS